MGAGQSLAMDKSIAHTTIDNLHRDFQSPPSYPCRFCKKIFSTPSALGDHRKDQPMLTQFYSQSSSYPTETKDLLMTMEKLKCFKEENELKISRQLPSAHEDLDLRL
ncbi:hypothetical protein FRX31_019660 [Thalictrum thalictroides]|uniref:C2H2-type domain-containing protein n=1 Tax=Thalictrum thalictroides TaxID=46969 RepID=A0A7J6W0Y5_THATH|nr:hypothetical protein FRX31_019660 [Thalictrum thalictroides]